MSAIKPVTIPLINPNEPEALLAALHVAEGQLVQPGDVLATLETTKSTAELEADEAGYVLGLRLAAGQTVRTGETLCYLGATPDAELPQDSLPAAEDHAPAPEGLRITQPALSLARQANLDLSQFPTGALVTEAVVRAALQAAQDPQAALRLPPAPFDPTAVLVYGGGGHGKAVIDLLRGLGTYQVAGIVDDGLAAGTQIMGVPVLGGAECLPDLFNRGVRLAANAVGGIGNVAVRVKIFRRLAEAGFALPALIHPSAVVERSAVLAPGVHVFPLAYVGSEARLDFGVIVNTRALVSHECQLEAYANLSPGAILAGQVVVGSGALVGMGATVNLQVKIGRLARVGNGATVKSDVPENGIVRAGSVWPA